MCNTIVRGGVVVLVRSSHFTFVSACSSINMHGMIFVYQDVKLQCTHYFLERYFCTQCTSYEVYVNVCVHSKISHKYSVEIVVCLQVFKVDATGMYSQKVCYKHGLEVEATILYGDLDESIRPAPPHQALKLLVKVLD